METFNNLKNTLFNNKQHNRDNSTKITDKIENYFKSTHYDLNKEIN